MKCVHMKLEIYSFESKTYLESNYMLNLVQYLIWRIKTQVIPYSSGYRLTFKYNFHFKLLNIIISVFWEKIQKYK